MHYELLTAQATQPNTGAAGTANTGDSLTIKNGRGKIYTLSTWASRQVSGFTQFFTPSSHDTTRGFRTVMPIGAGQLSMALGLSLAYQAQETIQSTLSGSNVAGDIELDSQLIYYADFPGISMRTISAQQLETRTNFITTVVSSVAAVATGQYSEELITADSDLLKANTDYAVLGMSSSLAVHAMTLKGPDLGNVRVGCPGVLRPELTAQFFQIMSRVHNLPLIPVINSGNKSATFVGFCADENAATTSVTLHLAELR